MTTINREQIEILIQIEAIETSSRKIKFELEGVNQKYESLDAELTSFENQVMAEEQRLGDLQKKYRSSEEDLKLNQSKIESSQEKLRSVKNNKEYQSSLKEIDKFKATGSKLEDNILECLEKIDQAELDINAKKKSLQQVTEDIDTQKAQIRREAEQDKAKLAKLDLDMGAIAEKIDSKLRRTYELVKQKQLDSVSVVPVKDAVCYGCNLNIPPQMYNELQRCDKLVFCPHCQRIIYWNGIDALK